MNAIAKALEISAVVLAVVGCGDSRESRIAETVPVYSSQGMDVVMRGASSTEVLSDWQVARAREWNRRNHGFLNCDQDGNGMLTGGEVVEYRSLLGEHDRRYL